MTTKYGLFIFSTDESATCMNIPLHLTDSIPDEITQPMMVDIVFNSKGESDKTTRAEFEQMTISQLSDYLVDKCDLFMDTVAVIEESKFTEIEELGSELLDSMVDDSSCYEAAAEFGDVLRQLAVRCLVLPQNC